MAPERIVATRIAGRTSSAPEAGNSFTATGNRFGTDDDANPDRARALPSSHRHSADGHGP